MNKFFYYTCITLAFSSGAVAIVGALIAYSVIKVAPDGVVYDAFNRVLTKAPIWARLLVLNEDLWPGLKWAFFDRISFFALWGLAYGLFRLSDKFEKIKNPENYITLQEEFKKINEIK
jgi:hypothetical protein